MPFNPYTLDAQTGSEREPFRIISVRKGDQEKWVGKVLKHDWYYTCIYIDTKEVFELHTNFNDKVIEKITNEERIERL